MLRDAEAAAQMPPRERRREHKAAEVNWREKVPLMILACPGSQRSCVSAPNWVWPSEPAWRRANPGAHIWRTGVWSRSGACGPIVVSQGDSFRLSTVPKLNNKGAATTSCFSLAAFSTSATGIQMYFHWIKTYVGTKKSKSGLIISPIITLHLYLTSTGYSTRYIKSVLRVGLKSIAI